MNNFDFGTHPQTYKDVKICTYAMCKNEIKFVDKWVDNVWNNGNGSDYICVLDTGSTDGTYEKLQSACDTFNIPKDRFILCQKEFKPWRFDISRNYGMDFMPDEHTIDVCYCIDLDEVVIEDFWDDLRRVVFEHPDFERIFYKYAWRIDTVTNEQKYVFWYDKIHGVKGWRWEFPVHETLTCSCPECYSGKYRLSNDKVYLKHFPDTDKSRSNYLPLLELRAKENPKDYYGKFYLAREYEFHSDYKKALFWAMSLYSTLISDKSCSEAVEIYADPPMIPCLLTHIASDFANNNMSDDAEFFYNKALAYNDTYQDAYIKYAQFLAYRGRYTECYELLDKMHQKAIVIDDWRVPKWAWKQWKETQIIADCKCWEGKYDEAYTLFLTAYNSMDEFDKQDANVNGFFSDFSFCTDKLQNLNGGN